MIEPHPVSARRPVVRAWLYVVAALMVLTLVVGGATRLTESGLSIVEWKPVTGVVPPISQAAWQAEFAKYQQIPQYRELNRGMTLDQFKTIYWWEWSHRLLARLVGAAFLLPFLVFLWRGWIEPPLRTRLWTLFGAGALLGAVGWWMVSSGLAGRVSVSQYRLAFHLTLACAIYAGILWTACSLGARSEGRAPRRLRASAIGLMILVLMQIYLGALVAGLDAGLTFNTWPEIDGALIPSADRLWFESPLWRNFFENTLTVQFDHRMVAYALWLVATLHAVDVIRARLGGAILNGALALACAVTIQAGIGVVTLLHQAPLPLALLHQATAIVVLTIAVVHAERLSPRHAAARFASQPIAAGTSIPRGTK
jgi:cytochrome c oxidase assembly protein subunit 15